MRGWAILLAIGLSGCGEVSGSSPHAWLKSITPGIVVKCDGKCRVTVGNVDNAPQPGERAP